MTVEFVSVCVPFRVVCPAGCVGRVSVPSVCAALLAVVFIHAVLYECRAKSLLIVRASIGQSGLSWPNIIQFIAIFLLEVLQVFAKSARLGLS